MKSKHQQMVEEFMLKAGQSVPDEPVVPEFKTRKLRANLIFEEAIEVIRDLGFEIRGSCNGGLRLERIKCGNIVTTAKEFCDLSVVLTGSFSAYGLQDIELLNCVDSNNLDKFGPGHSVREDGKLIKPKNFKKPDLNSIIYPDK